MSTPRRFLSLQAVIDEMTDDINNCIDAINALRADAKALKSEVKTLKSELETERRLRLGKRK